MATAAAQHGARFVTASVLYLKPGVKEHFEGFLRREYPDLVPRYRSMFPGAYAPGGYTRRLHDLVRVLQDRYGLAPQPPSLARLAAGPVPGQQLALAL